MQTFKRTLTVLLIAYTLAGLSVQAGMPAEFNAVYQLHKFGLNAAESTSTLRKLPDGRWSYSSSTETRGVVSIFRKDRIVEEALLQEHAGRIRPLSFRYIHEGSKKNRNRSIRFDWQKMEADTTVSGQRSVLPIQAGTLDNFSLQLQLMQDMQTGKRPLVYTVIKKGKIDDQVYEVLGEERIETDAGVYDTFKLQRSRDDSKRTTIMWTAPALDYLPVKIMHVEPDGSEFSLVLESISGPISRKQPVSSQGSNR